MPSDEAGSPQMRLITATRLWNFPTQIYTIGRLRIPTILGPISWRLVGFAVVAFTPALVAGLLFGVPFAGLGLTVQLLVPGLLVWWALRYAAEGGSPRWLATSATRYAARVVVGAARDARRGSRPVVLVPRRRGARFTDGACGSPAGRGCAWAFAVVVALSGGRMAERLGARGARPGWEVAA